MTAQPSMCANAVQVHLLAACTKRGLPVLCAGGAGAKADPTKLRFVDIQEATSDPLVRAVRHQLRLRHGIRSGVTVLMSTERPRCGLVASEEQEAAVNLHEYQVHSFCSAFDSRSGNSSIVGPFVHSRSGTQHFPTLSTQGALRLSLMRVRAARGFSVRAEKRRPAQDAGCVHTRRVSWQARA
jgi:hypothetical protein